MLFWCTEVGSVLDAIPSWRYFAWQHLRRSLPMHRASEHRYRPVSRK